MMHRKEKKDEIKGGGGGSGGHHGRLLDFLLPRALNTRRRYSAFRPVPLPHQQQDQIVNHTLSTTSISSITASELISIEMMEKGNLTVDLGHPTTSPPVTKETEKSHAHAPGSDLDQFLNGLSKLNRQDQEEAKANHALEEEEDARSVTSSWMSVKLHRCKEKLPVTLVGVLGVLTLVHAIAFIAFFASSEEYDSLDRRLEKCFVRHGNLSFCARVHDDSIYLELDNDKPPHDPWKDTG